jgi:hypothetical protein
LTKHNDWRRLDDLTYFNDRTFVQVQAVRLARGAWVVSETFLSESKPLRSFSSRERARAFIVQYVRTRPNG